VVTPDAAAFPTPIESAYPISANALPLVRKASWAVQLNEHIAERGDMVFRHACKLGFEGIVSKRLGSPYVSGRSRHWIKSKNPAAPAVKREARRGLGRKTMAMIEAGRDVLILKRASASRSSGHWSDDDFDGLADPWQAPDVDFSFRAPRGSNADHGYAARARLPWLRLPRVGGGNEAFCWRFYQNNERTPVIARRSKLGPEFVVCGHCTISMKAQV
jgi:hypothetical protein